MEAYVINLPKNSNRLEIFLKNYYKSDLQDFKLNIFEAINGKKINIEEHVTPEALEQIKTTEKTGVRTHHHHLTRGAVGCYLSHLSIYESIYEKIYENVYDKNKDSLFLIFEDDSVIPSNLYEIIIDNLLVMPDDWDIINFSCICAKCTDKIFYKIAERFFMTNCYLINLKGIKKFLDHSKSKKIDKQIDSEMSLMAFSKNLNVYCSKTFIDQQSFKTDIQTPLYHSVFQDPYDMGIHKNKNMILISICIILLIILCIGIFVYFYYKDKESKF